MLNLVDRYRDHAELAAITKAESGEDVMQVMGFAQPLGDVVDIISDLALPITGDHSSGCSGLLRPSTPGNPWDIAGGSTTCSLGAVIAGGGGPLSLAVFLEVTGWERRLSDDNPIEGGAHQPD